MAKRNCSKKGLLACIVLVGMGCICNGDPAVPNGDDAEPSLQEQRFCADMRNLADAFYRDPAQVPLLVGKWHLTEFPEFRELYDTFDFYAALSRNDLKARWRLRDGYWNRGKPLFRLKCYGCNGKGTKHCKSCGGTGKCKSCHGTGQKKTYRTIVSGKRMESVQVLVACDPYCPVCHGKPSPCPYCNGCKGKLDIPKVRQALSLTEKRLQALLTRPDLYPDYSAGRLAAAMVKSNRGSYRDRIRMLSLAMLRFPKARNMAQAQKLLEHYRNEHAMKEIRVKEAIERSRNGGEQSMRILEAVIADFPDASNINWAITIKKHEEQQASNPHGEPTCNVPTMIVVERPQDKKRMTP